MKLKKIAAVALTAVMLLSTCACEKGNMIDKYYNYDAMQYIKAGQYENVVIEYDDPAATDEEIEKVIASFLNQYATWIDTDRTVVQAGDKVTIDYRGILDGFTYEDMQEQNVEFEIGSETYYKDFENALIGKPLLQGDNKNIVWVEVTFPEDYFSGGIAGKTVEYKVWINKIKEKVLSEFTDELVNEKTEGKYTTAAEYTEFVRNTITERKQKIIDDRFATTVWNKVVNSFEVISYPEDRMAYYEEETTASLKQTWKESTKVLDFESFIQVYLDITYEEYLEQLKEKCERLVKEELVLLAIAREKGMSIEWSDYKKRARDYLKIYDCKSVSELEKVISRSEICLTILNDDINKLILETASGKIKEYDTVS